MSLETPGNPWDGRGLARLKPPSMVQFSQGWIAFFVLGNLALLGILGAEWTMNSMKLVEQDARLASLHEDVDYLQERDELAQGFTRTYRAVGEVAKGKMNPRQVAGLTETLWKQSRRFGFDPLLIVAVMQIESASNPWARGQLQSGAASGALGLMQLKLETAQLMGRSLGIEIRSEADLMKPDVNLLLGSYYLMRMVVRYGNLSKGLMAYNIGPYGLEARERSGQKLPVAYFQRILDEYRGLVDQHGPQ